MKKLGIMTAAALLVAMTSSISFAAVNAGENEVSISGSIMSTKMDGVNDTVDSTIIRGGMGHYLTDNISLGGDLTYINTSSGSFDSTTFVANINGRFYFLPKETIVPYVGAQLGYLSSESGSSTSTGYNYGAMAGIKFFMSENASFDAELNYRKDTLSASGSSKDIEQTTTAGLFGLTYYFGKK